LVLCKDKLFVEFKSLDCVAKSSKYEPEIDTLLHGNYLKVVLFVNPNQESSSIVAEDSSVIWPVSIVTSSLDKFISILEEEMFINEMFLFLFAQAFQTNELTGEIIFKSITGLFDLVQNLFSLLVSDT